MQTTVMVQTHFLTSVTSVPTDFETSDQFSSTLSGDTVLSFIHSHPGTLVLSCLSGAEFFDPRNLCKFLPMLLVSNPRDRPSWQLASQVPFITTVCSPLWSQHLFIVCLAVFEHRKGHCPELDTLPRPPNSTSLKTQRTFLTVKIPDSVKLCNRVAWLSPPWQAKLSHWSQLISAEIVFIYVKYLHSKYDITNFMDNTFSLSHSALAIFSVYRLSTKSHTMAVCNSANSLN